MNIKSNAYQKYSVRDFDRHNCLKISPSIYIVLLFVLRGYIVWIMSVTNLRDRVGIIQWIYPETSLFYLSLFSGTLGLFVVVLLSLRRPNSALWIKVCWPYCRLFLILALLFDLAINSIGYIYWQIITMQWLTIQITIVAVLLAICFFDQRIKINIQEFPEDFN